jgi:hypothetical protein
MILRKRKVASTGKGRSGKKVVRVLLLTILLLCFAGLLSGCFTLIRYIQYESGNLPCHQVGSKWRTEDGRIEFTIIDTFIPEHEETLSNGTTYKVMADHWHHGEGTFMTADGNRIPIVYTEGAASEWHILIRSDEKQEDDLDPETEIYEYWGISRVRDGYIEFAAEKTGIFEPGDTIRLYRVEP